MSADSYLKRELYQLVQQDERIFHFIQESALDGLWYWDLENPEEEWMNPKFWTVLGYDPEEMPHKCSAWNEIIYEEDLRLARENLIRHCEDPDYPYDQMVRYRHKGGGTVWIRCRGLAIRDEAGKPVRMLGAHNDVTESKKQEAALRQNNRLLEMFFSQSLHGFFICMLDEPVAWNAPEADHEKLLEYGLSHQRMTKVNQALLDQYGATEEQFLGISLRDLQKHDLEQARDVLGTLFSGGHLQVETREQKLDGTPIVIEGEYSCLYDDQGRIKGLFGVQVDVTERKRVEDALRESESRFKEIFRNIETVAIQGYAMDGTVTYWNSAAAEFYGYSAEEVMGKNLLDLIIPPEMRAGVRQEMAKMAQTGQVIPSSELSLMRKDGSRIPVYSSHSYVQVPGKEPELFCIDIDLSQRKEAEEKLLETNQQLEAATARANDLAQRAEAANKAKSEFLANMSHEIRTPMNGILGMTEILLDYTELTEEQRRCGEVVKSCGKSLLSLVEDILDFSKIEAGKLQLENTDFVLLSLLDELSSTMAFKANDKGLHLSCYADPDVPAVLSGDPVRLRQVLVNLVDNGLKFTEEGEVSVRVSRVEAVAPRDAEGPCWLHFSVRDTGIGIPGGNSDRIFEHFTQLDGSTTRRFGGTGLGLAISKQLVEMMGGEIGVVSVEGEGSEFWFLLPLGMKAGRRSRKVAGSFPPPAESLPMLAGRSARILVAEDNRYNQEVALATLKKLGYSAEVVGNGREAMEALQARSYDLILMDVEMPEVNGLDATKEIRDSTSPFCNPHIPILAMTAHASQDSRKSCLEAGMNDYIAKPVLPNQLDELLRKWLPG